MAISNDCLMTVSGLLGSRESGQYVLVRFEDRNETAPKKKVIIGEGERRIREERKPREAEIKLPSLEVVLNKGFREDEIEKLRDYLKENEKEIMEKARSISSFLHIFG